MNKTIVVFEDSSKVGYSGGQTVTRHIVEGLFHQGYTVILADFTDSSHFQDKISRYISRKLVLKSVVSNPPSGQSTYTPVKKFQSLISILPVLIHNIRILLSANLSSDIIVYSCAREASIFGIIFAKIKRLKSVAHVHSNEPKGSFEYRLMRFVYSFYNKVFFVSEFLAEHYLLNNSCLLYNPVEQIKCRDYISSRFGRFYRIIFVGKLYTWKGISILIDALSSKKFEAHIQNITFHIYGDGPLKNELLLKLKDSKLRYEFFGFVDDKREIYCGADLLVLPSIAAESCPMVLIESYMNKVPFITTNIGGQNELATLMSQSVFPASDPEALCDTLIQSYAKSNYSLQSLEANLPTISNIFSHSNHMRKILGLLKVL